MSTFNVVCLLITGMVINCILGIFTIFYKAPGEGQSLLIPYAGIIGLSATMAGATTYEWIDLHIGTVVSIIAISYTTVIYVQYLLLTRNERLRHKDIWISYVGLYSGLVYVALAFVAGIRRVVT